MIVPVRIGGLSDAADIAALTGQLGYDVDAAVLTKRLTRILERSDQRLLVADVDAHAVGWLHAVILEDIETDPFVVIAGLVVHASHRRQGIGRALLLEAEKWAQQQQCSVVRLWSSVGRTAAHRFYEQLGYTSIKTQHSFAKSLDDERDLQAFIPRIADRIAGE
jgi:GNAT superfamily N-acetyltransferase